MVSSFDFTSGLDSRSSLTARGVYFSGVRSKSSFGVIRICRRYSENETLAQVQV